MNMQTRHIPFVVPGFVRQPGMACLLFCMLLLTGCGQEAPLAQEINPAFEPEIPPGVPAMPPPADDFLNQAKIDLGRRLFFDPILSADSTISCGSCHIQELAFADDERFSTGLNGRKGFRNAPALFNLAWHESFNKDGGTPTLETQVEVPLTDTIEMGQSIRESLDKLNAHPQYPELFYRAYGSRTVTGFTLTRALGAFERSLISLNSPYDRYQYYGERNALSEAQLRGLELFNSAELNCVQCHSGFNFRKEGWENNGLYAFYADSGRARVTFNPDDAGKFKVMSLRNVALTAPYMHDGSLATLEEVIDHYAGGGVRHRNQSPLVDGFQISDAEKADLIAFLESLTDQSFLVNPDYRSPF